MTKEIRTENGKGVIYTYDENIYSSLDEAILATNSYNTKVAAEDAKPEDQREEVIYTGFESKEAYIEPERVSSNEIDFSNLTEDQKISIATQIKPYL